MKRVSVWATLLAAAVSILPATPYAQDGKLHLSNVAYPLVEITEAMWRARISYGIDASATRCGNYLYRRTVITNEKETRVLVGFLLRDKVEGISAHEFGRDLRISGGEIFVARKYEIRSPDGEFTEGYMIGLDRKEFELARDCLIKKETI